MTIFHVRSCNSKCCKNAVNILYFKNIVLTIYLYFTQIHELGTRMFSVTDDYVGSVSFHWYIKNILSGVCGIGRLCIYKIATTFAIV